MNIIVAEKNHVLTFAATNNEVSANATKATPDNMAPLTLPHELSYQPGGFEVPQLDLL